MGCSTKLARGRVKHHARNLALMAGQIVAQLQVSNALLRMLSIIVLLNVGYSQRLKVMPSRPITWRPTGQTCNVQPREIAEIWRPHQR